MNTLTPGRGARVERAGCARGCRCCRRGRSRSWRRHGRSARRYLSSSAAASSVGGVGVGHVHEAGQAAGDGRRRFGGHVGLVFQAGLAEVHLVVDHARQQAAAGGIDDILADARVEPAADLLDAAIDDAQVALELAALVDEAGVDDERRGVGHVRVLWEADRIVQARGRGRPGAGDGSGRCGAARASRRARRQNAGSPDGVFRAGWHEPAARSQQWAEPALVGAQAADEQMIDHGFGCGMA